MNSEVIIGKEKHELLLQVKKGNYFYFVIGKVNNKEYEINFFKSSDNKKIINVTKLERNYLEKILATINQKEDINE